MCSVGCLAHGRPAPAGRGSVSRTSADIRSTETGHILIEYSDPTLCWWLTPDEAREMAVILNTLAEQAKPPLNVVQFRQPGCKGGT